VRALNAIRNATFRERHVDAIFESHRDRVDQLFGTELIDTSAIGDRFEHGLQAGPAVTTRDEFMVLEQMRHELGVGLEQTATQFRSLVADDADAFRMGAERGPDRRQHDEAGHDVVHREATTSFEIGRA
jgi:hypothetical protein